MTTPQSDHPDYALPIVDTEPEPAHSESLTVVARLDGGLSVPTQPPGDGVTAPFDVLETAAAEPIATPQVEARPVRWWEPVLVMVLTFAVLAAVTPQMMRKLDPVTGDEPFYLMTAISLIKDHDLNECNNYRQRDEAALYPASVAKDRVLPRGWQGWTALPYPLPPHPAKIVPATRRCFGSDVVPLVRGIPDASTPLPPNGTENELYSKHGLGLALMVLLPYAAGGRLPVVLFLNLVGALVAVNIYLFARQGTGRVLPAVLTWVAFSFTVPLMPYSFLIFPELPAALLTIYAFRRIWRGSNNLFQLFLIGCSIGFLPWLHYRFTPISAGLFIFFLYRLYRTKELTRGDRLNSLAMVLSPVVVGASWLLVYFQFLYKHPWPGFDDHAGISDLAGTARGAAGAFLDQQWGLFVAAPVFILAIVGVLIMAAQRERRGELLWLAAVFLPYFLVISNYAQWWGEWGPPARYLAAALPLLALPFAVALDRIRGIGYKTLYGVLLLLSFAAIAGFTYQPQWMYNHPDGNNKLLDNTVLPRLLPSLGSLPDLRRQIIHEDDKSIPHLWVFPSFVIPYFGYTLRDKESGDYWSNVAWQRSIVPGVIVLVIVAVSLLFAWLYRPRPQPYYSRAGPVGA